MIFRLLADSVVAIHLLFVVFAMLGGLLAFRWRKTIWVHLPAVLWAALIEFGGWICPLTPLENRLRIAGGNAGYTGGFVEHYLLPLLYPGDLTRSIQVLLGILVVTLNLFIYGYLFLKIKTKDGRKKEA
jgi:hypothetical protein